MHRLCILVVAMPLLAQDPNQHLEAIEKAHSSLIQPPAPKSRVAGSVTAELTSSLPRQGTTLQKVPIRTFVDQHIFGRMNRDKVPHAGLASDEEFARRAWLDATGRIPPSMTCRRSLRVRTPASATN